MFNIGSFQLNTESLQLNLASLRLDEVSSWLAGMSTLVLLSAALIAIRSRRLRRWNKMLATRASALVAQEGSWKSKLPRGIQLDSELPLFEVLYGGHQAKPRLSASSDLKGTLLKAEPAAKFGLSSSPSDEDTISHLISLRGYQQVGFLPIDAVASSLLGNLTSVLKGKKKLVTGMEHAVLESLGAGGGFAGAKIGNILGLGLIPLAASAGPLVLPLSMLAGAWLGSVAGRKIGDRVKARQLHSAMKKLRSASKNLKRSFLERFPELMDELDRDYALRIGHVLGLRRWNERRLRRMFFPGIMTAFYSGAVRRLRADWDEDRKQWQSIRKKVRFIRPLEFAYVLYGLGEESFLSDSTLLASYQQYEAAVSEVREAQGQVA